MPDVATPLAAARPRGHLTVDYLLLGLLALLWGSSYGWLKGAGAERPPLTLIAARVAGAAIFLTLVMAWRRERLPAPGRIWGMLLVQALCNSIISWTVLAWGQQYVDAGLASVLNSTSILFVALITALFTRHEALVARKLAVVLIGLAGVVLIVGIEALGGLGHAVAGEAACLTGAALYGAGAIYGRRFGSLSPVATATGTMLWATATLVPLALVIDRPWQLDPSSAALVATAALSILCTGLALLIYFRLVHTLGSMGVASQSYLRAGVGVALGMIFLGETITPSVALGIAATIAGVVLINWPKRPA